MSVRRHAARWATVGALLGGLVAAPASPAMADGDRVGLRSAGSFTAGGSAGAVAIEVRKRTEGCVQLRTVLGLRLDGLRADQVRVQVATAGRWVAVPVAGGGGDGGVVTTGQVAPVDRPLCKGKGAVVRYRVTFLAGAVGGRLELAGEASAANGQVLGRAGRSARLVGAERTPSATPTPSRKPSPTPTPSAVVSTAAEAAGTSPLVAAVDPAAGAAADSSSGGSLIMWFGIALVLVGAALIVLLLVRRNRADRADGGPAADQPPVPLPRSSTTYRSQTPGATPTVYGGATPPRPSGNVYGAPPATPPAPPAEDATSVLPRMPD
ncbi:hypothetical protein [Micromonospora humi]|uniref:LPXTG-motif cell wall anchor domain-containing protein n=1 Tax=Micromonospora humi TaxID=745366 RepID=A0A1C5HVB0_9ACTN|nr:hypothetical protein [Micromonospora humi]SCG49902.1 hypothetical protein GA0070213_10465 [Micromonospora humi]